MVSAVKESLSKNGFSDESINFLSENYPALKEKISSATSEEILALTEKVDLQTLEKIRKIANEVKTNERFDK